jgi:hypothetical protein
VAARSKASVCGLSLTGTAGSNLCVVRWRSLRRADHSSRGVLPSVVCLRAIEEPHRGGLDPVGLSSHEKKSHSRKRSTTTIVIVLMIV